VRRSFDVLVPHRWPCCFCSSGCEVDAFSGNGFCYLRHQVVFSIGMLRSISASIVAAGIQLRPSAPELLVREKLDGPTKRASMENYGRIKSDDGLAGNTPRRPVDIDVSRQKKASQTYTTVETPFTFQVYTWCRSLHSLLLRWRCVLRSNEQCSLWLQRKNRFMIGPGDPGTVS